MADDTRYAYAVARIRGLETGLLDRQWIERLLAEDAAGALKVLGDSSYQDALSETGRPEDVEDALAVALAETLATVSALSPEPELIDLFRVRWDFRNMKSLTKASVLKMELGENASGDEARGGAENADIGVVGVGTLPPAVLSKAAVEGEYAALPPALAEAARAAVEAFEATGELADIDRTFDRAMWADQIATAREHRNDFLVGYFRTEIDLLNVRTFVRVKDAGGDADELRGRLVPGGTLDASFFESRLGEPVDAFARSLEYGTYGALAPVLREWAPDRGFALELACDNVLLDRVDPAKTVAYGVDPLVAYVLVRLIEVKLVRAALVGKLDGVPRETIEERLRSVHV